MASCKETSVLCGICEAQHITNAANVWCPECEEGLCCKCETQHNVSKSSKSHTVIHINDYLKLPKAFLDIVHHCTEHDRKYQMFCAIHDDLCCPLCISSYHKDCTGILAIEEIVKMSDSAVLENTEQVLDDLIRNVDEVIKNRKQNLAEIKEKRRKFQSQINKLRNQLVSHISNIEKQALKNLDLVEKRISSEIEQILMQFTEKARVIAEYQKNFSAIRKHASQLQIHLALKTVVKSVEEEEKQTKQLFEESNFQNIALKLKINECVISNITGLNSLCSVETEVSPNSFVFQSSKEKQAQMFSVSKFLSNYCTIRLSLETNFHIAKEKQFLNITGCTILSSNRLVLADCDPNKRLLIMRSDGTFLNEVCLSPSRPYDVDNVDENTVAVSTWNPNEIQVINLKTKTKTRYNAKDIRGGLAHLPDKWVYRDRNGLAVLQESDRTISTFVKEKIIPRAAYVAAFQEHVYSSNYEDATVTCYALDGKLIWKYNNDRLIKRPFGITVDNDLNVYVVSSECKNILLISPDGMRSRYLLDADFLSESPRAIDFDRKRKKLLVVSESGCVYLFSVV